MLDKTKTDEKLGIEVNKYIESKGVQTPMLKNNYDTDTSVKKIAEKFKDIMGYLNLDLSDDSLSETPKRVGKMFTKELFWGLKPENFPKCTTVKNKIKYNEMIVEKNITSMSTCEHHFVTIDGVCHIGYIPNDKVIGLSKLNRITEYFSRRPQIQERLTEQIFYALEYILGTSDIAVVITGNHYCVKSRGVEDSNSNTTTSKLGGKFMDISLRNEFMSLIKQ